MNPISFRVSRTNAKVTVTLNTVIVPMHRKLRERSGRGRGINVFINISYCIDPKRKKNSDH